MQVLASASAGVDDDCNASLFTATATGDVRDADETVCDINVSAVSNSVADNVVASAVFEAEAFACEGRAEAGGRAVARVCIHRCESSSLLPPPPHFH